ncbi:UNVERIFIED_CONTAM: usp20 [Trichonephila clavipes]
MAIVPEFLDRTTLKKLTANKYNKHCMCTYIIKPQCIGVPPQKATFAEELCTIIPQAVWEYLHDTFSGGPPCTHLYICPICQAEQNNLNEKRKRELEEFTALNAAFQRLENPSVVYAIGMNWFKIWEIFVCKNGEVPGPIDNSAICYVKNNQAVLKQGSDFCSMSKEMYQYLHNIYGGGPDIILQPTAKVSSQSSTTSNPGQSKSLSTVSNHDQVHTSSKMNLSSHSHTLPCSNSKQWSLIEPLKKARWAAG